MKNKLRTDSAPGRLQWSRRAMIGMALLVAASALGAPAWTPLANQAPGGVQMLLLLSDGTVLAQQNSNNVWYRLTPDGHGSYINGTWTTIASMGSTRRFYASAVLRDGRVLIAGAEYGTGWGNSEVYDPVANTWTTVSIPAGLLQTNNVPGGNGQNSAGFSDAGSSLLPDGRVLVAPVFPALANGTLIFNPAGNTWIAGPAASGSQNEASWVKLPDDSILTVDKNSTASERYIPALNQWIADGAVPVPLYGSGAEIGSALLLPDGRAFFIGGNNNTAFYTPSGTTNPGTWTAGPALPNGLSAPDAAAAALVNGHVLCALSPLDTTGTNAFTTPTSFYDYDPVANTFAQVNAPTGQTQPGASYKTSMLALPDGSVLYANEGATLYVYQPNVAQLGAGQPTINSITANPDGSFHLVGTRLNGISTGAVYGEDKQMDSNFPLVRLADNGGNVSYGRTFSWSSTSVASGSRPVSTEFSISPTLLPGTYSLVAVANGISSNPVSFPAPRWVDFNGSGFLQIGSYNFPFVLLATALPTVPVGGFVFFKTAGSSVETMTINQPMTLVAAGGPVSIGR